MYKVLVFQFLIYIYLFENNKKEQLIIRNIFLNHIKGKLFVTLVNKK